MTTLQQTRSDLTNAANAIEGAAEAIEQAIEAIRQMGVVEHVAPTLFNLEHHDLGSLAGAVRRIGTMVLVLDQVPCPRDTDGDGNCGQRHCPICEGGPR